MKRFLTRLCILCLPILAILSFAEYLLRNIPNDYALKVAAYKEHGGEMETLVLGSSHAYYGLNPSFFTTKTFNGAHVGQTLDLDAAIFHKFQPHLPKLKYVILSISDMSLFFKLANSAENWRIKNYTIYYHLHPTERPEDYFEMLNLPLPINRTRLIAYYIKKENTITSTPLGFGFNYNSSAKQDLDTTALKALRIHKAKNSEYLADEQKSLEYIISTCDKNNIKVILFTPPAYITYSSHIDSMQFATAVHTCKAFTKDYKNVSYYDFLNDTSFTANDYFDADHLNEIGAEKLSRKLDSIINHLGNNQ